MECLTKTNEPTRGEEMDFHETAKPGTLHLYLPRLFLPNDRLTRHGYPDGLLYSRACR